MKRLILLIFAILMAFSLSVSAFAASGSIVTDTLGDIQPDIIISGRYEASIEAENVYAVDVSWANMNFVYHVKAYNVWNSNTHQYTLVEEILGWEGIGSIAVANHSNAAVSVGFAFEAADGMTGLTGNFTKDSFQLAAAVEGSAQSAAPKDTTELTLSGGSLAPTQTTDTPIGSVTVSISAVSAEE